MIRSKVLFSVPWGVLFLISCSTDTPSVRDGRALDLDLPGADGALPADGALHGCLLGAAFLDCPGATTPALYCSSTSCKWISTGKAVSPYWGKTDTSCHCEGASCPPATVIYHFVYARGGEPWTREKDLNVTTTINPALALTQESVNCTGCDAACQVGDNPCTGEKVGVIYREMPGTYQIQIWTNGGLYGWMLELEMDFGSSGGPKARACRLPLTDNLSCTTSGPPRCATSGSIELSGEPTPQQLKVAGKFDLTFADGLRIQGQFTSNK